MEKAGVESSAVVAPTAKGGRWWTRFSLRTLLMLTLILSNVMWVWFAPEWKLVNRSSDTLHLQSATFLFTHLRYYSVDGDAFNVPTMNLSEYPKFSSPGFIASPAYSNGDAGYLAGVMDLSSVVIWHIPSGRRVGTLICSENIIRCKFGENDTQLVIQRWSGAKETWQRNYGYGWSGQLKRPEVVLLIALMGLAGVWVFRARRRVRADWRSGSR